MTKTGFKMSELNLFIEMLLFQGKEDLQQCLDVVRTVDIAEIDASEMYK